MSITNRKVMKYELKVETGLHIGGSKEIYGIGGIDTPVIKNPFTNQPIIPGSSIKGKMRMLLENVQDEEYNCDNHKDSIDKMFGSESQDGSLTRIIFRDLRLTETSAQQLQEKLGTGFYTEVKAENKLMNENVAKPRFIERVPAGAIFEGECIIQETNEDTYEDFETLLKEGFQLLEKSYLGANGSRGYGKITISIK